MKFEDRLKEKSGSMSTILGSKTIYFEVGASWAREETIKEVQELLRGYGFDESCDLLESKLNTSINPNSSIPDSKVNYEFTK